MARQEITYKERTKGKEGRSGKCKTGAGSGI